MFSDIFHYNCALESELLVWISNVLTELRKNEISIFLKSNLETCYNFDNVSF